LFVFLLLSLKSISQSAAGTRIQDYQYDRIVRSALAGFIGHGPMSHVWYNVCDHLFMNVFHCTAWWNFIPKIGLDQFAWSPIWNNSYLLLIGLMQRQNISMIVDQMKRTTIPLMLDGLKLWPAVHVVTYSFIPIENRLLWVDMVEIIWVVILASTAAADATSSSSSTTSSSSQSLSLSDDSNVSDVISNSGVVSSIADATIFVNNEKILTGV
jgi:protein Mpv17